ncbi:unnamed protein product [Dicrocoelium dendriticum]|nr:unnamed protein product [Dicrocoelium dendriticum]
MNGWQQHVSKPTRGNSIFDLIFSLGIPAINVTVLNEFPGSDHRVVKCYLRLRMANEPHLLHYRLFNSVNWNTFKDMVRSMNWDDFFLSPCPQKAADVFYEIIGLCIDSLVPLKCACPRKQKPDHKVLGITRKLHKIRRKFRLTADFSLILQQAKIVEELRHLNVRNLILEEYKALNGPNKTTELSMTLRDRAWRMYKSNPSAENWTEYVSHRNYCVLLVREDKRTHQQELAKRFCSNKKLLYKHVNGLRKVQRGIPPLNTTNGYTHTAKEAANALRAQYFPIFQGVQASTYIPPLVTPPPVLSNVTFTAEMVLQKLLSLRPHSSPGADNIHPKTLQVAAIHLAEPLAALFQRGFDENIVPSRWKQGVITPIYKAGSRSDPANYRPVTLLPVIAKVMEAVVADALMGYLESYGIIAPKQHGFRQHRSCTANLLIARDNWTETVDEGTGVDVAFLDFSKAFDRLDHRILLIKLQQYGVGDPLLGWIGNFLSEWQLEFDHPFPIRFEWDAAYRRVRVTMSKFLLFADDLKVWRAIKRSDDHEVLQRDLNEAWNCSVRNAVPFNVNKCRVVHIRHRQVYVYKLGAHDLKTTTQERDLGVLVQEDLGCSKQSDSASKRGNQHVGLLRRAFGILDPSIFSLMLNAYVRPHVEYAIQAWQPWLKRDLAALETPQRRATKIVKGLRHTPYQERLEILGVFSGRYRRLRGDLILVYQILSDPSHVCRHLLKLSPNTNLRGNSLKLSQQYSRLYCRRTYFSPRVCGPWNALPNSVVCAPTLDTFKKRLDVALSALRFVL